jgi:uncharacterized protein YbjT (DUF2867 family)
VDKVYLATNGPDVLSAETNLINAARSAGVQHLVKVSVIGASPDHIGLAARTHAAIEEVLAQSDVSATILRPNWFMENFLSTADSIIHQGAIYGSAGEGRVAFIDSRDTAAAAVAVLTRSGRAGKAYQLTGPAALTFAEAAEQLAVGIGRPVRYVDLSDEAVHTALTSGGVPGELAAIYLQINRNARAGSLAETTDTIAQLTGNPPRSLATFARDHAAVFSSTSAQPRANNTPHTASSSASSGGSWAAECRIPMPKVTIPPDGVSSNTGRYRSTT